MTYRIDLPFIARLTLIAALWIGSAPAHAQTTDGHQTMPRTTPSTAFGDTHDCVNYYPDISRRLNQSGDVLIQYDVGADGSVSDVKVVRSSGIRALDQAALQCVSQHWRNRPATANGIPIASPGHQAIIRFVLHDSPSDIGALAPYMSPIGPSNPAPVANASTSDDDSPSIWEILIWTLGPPAIFGWIVWGARRWVFRARSCPVCDARNRSILPFTLPGYCSSCGTRFMEG
jgi:TonB family protein